MRLSASMLRALLFATLAMAPIPILAEAAVPVNVVRQLTAAAESGPWALLDDLSRVLAADPSLAASPADAVALARVVAGPVPDFVGANLPVYREIEDRIVAAAPPAQREAVRQAVGQELSIYVANDIRIMPPLPPMGTGNVPRQSPQIGAAGYKVGSYTIYPSIYASTFFDDNIYATPNNAVSDLIGTISPMIALQSNWDRNSLYAEAGTDLTGYWTHGSENTIDWHTLVQGRVDASASTRILLGAIALHEHEDRASPDAVEGFTPTPYTELKGYAGVVHRRDDLSIRLASAVEHITFGNVEGLHGEINNKDRNRNRYTFGVLVRHEANSAFRPFVEALGDIRQYENQPDDFGYYRSSNGFKAGVGALFRIMPSVSGEAFIGLMYRSYDDPRFEQITTPAADASVRWQAAENTAIVLFLDRSVEETTLAGSPAYIYTVTGGRIEQSLTTDLTGLVRLAFARSNFVQVPRWDNEADMSIGLRYRLIQRVYLGVDLRHTQRISEDSTVNFDRNEAYFNVSSEF